jgi:hypothetical protein
MNNYNGDIDNIVDSSKGEIGNTVDIIITTGISGIIATKDFHDAQRKLLNMDFNILQAIKYINVSTVPALKFQHKTDYSDEIFSSNYDRYQIIISNNDSETIKTQFFKIANNGILQIYKKSHCEQSTNGHMSCFSLPRYTTLGDKYNILEDKPIIFVKPNDFSKKFKFRDNYQTIMNITEKYTIIKQKTNILRVILNSFGGMDIMIIIISI